MELPRYVEIQKDDFTQYILDGFRLIRAKNYQKAAAYFAVPSIQHPTERGLAIDTGKSYKRIELMDKAVIVYMRPELHPESPEDDPAVDKLVRRVGTHSSFWIENPYRTSQVFNFRFPAVYNEVLKISREPDPDGKYFSQMPPRVVTQIALVHAHLWGAAQLWLEDELTVAQNDREQQALVPPFLQAHGLELTRDYKEIFMPERF